jgi:UDP:flavonoid glycosyltransferase YjiC (YdhE family)
MARVVMVTLGSWGDLFPFIDLGRELVARGNSAVVCSSAAHEDLVRSAGIEFRQIGRTVDFDDYRRHPEILSSRLGGFSGLRAALDLFVFSQIDRLVDDLVTAAGDADVVVAHPAHAAAPIAAEVVGLPLVTASVFPGLIPTRRWPPGSDRAAAVLGRWLGPSYNRLAWQAARALCRRAFDPPSNDARRRVGLRPRRDNLLRATTTDSERVLVLASPRIISRPSDWPAHVELTGFTTWDNPGWAVSDELRRFLSEGPPVVLVTLGSSGALDPADFFAVTVAAARQLGRRVLVVAGPSADQVPEQTDDVFVARLVPYSAVLPQCAAAVHHAGIGTAVQCWRAGVPQLVLPRAFDQPLTAALICGRHTGLSVPWPPRLGRVRDALRQLLDDGLVRDHARALAAALGDEEGSKTAVDAIEKVVDDQLIRRRRPHP